jgi:regulator of protease activity HflC (stomatin/prohibitin superfamily)
VDVPANVREAMAGVVAAQRERDARKARTDGEVYERVSLAKAKAEEDAIRAQGISNARSAVADGLREAAEKLIGTGINAEFLMQWIYKQDELRVREKFAREKTTVFMTESVSPALQAAVVHANLVKPSDSIPPLTGLDGITGQWRQWPRPAEHPPSPV